VIPEGLRGEIVILDHRPVAHFFELSVDFVEVAFLEVSFDQNFYRYDTLLSVARLGNSAACP